VCTRERERKGECRTDGVLWEEEEGVLTVQQVSSTTEMITIFSESLQSRLAECLKSLKKRVLYLQEKLRRASI
jgi:hypothetical protein